MHFHYFTLVHLVKDLKQKYLGETLESCFSQNKNELILEFNELVLRVGCNTPLTYVIPVKRFSRAKKNVVELFPELRLLALKDVYVVPYDRVMILRLSNEYDIILKLHGPQSNVLVRKDGQVSGLFNTHLKTDESYKETPGYFHGDMAQEDFVPISAEAVYTHLRKISSVFEKTFAAHIWHTIQSGSNFSAAFEAVMERIGKDEFWIVEEAGKMRMLFFPLSGEHRMLTIQGVSDALNFFFRAYYQFEQYRTHYKMLEKEIAKPYEKYLKVQASFLESIRQLETERNPEEIGHILMAHLHVIEVGSKQVELEDFYTGETLKIKLKTDLNPQENAQAYYNKSRQRKVRIHVLYSELEDVERKLKDSTEAWNEFKLLIPPDKLNFTLPYGFDFHELDQIRRFQKSTHETGSTLPNVPYLYFEYDGYQIFVGKNAKNNDELSFKYAAKEDIWLHAKDVTGAHVVIRKKAGNNIPSTVLEYAASLAAYYSKRKNDSLVPVSYTPRKYIRKRKGDPAGAVVVERESVIMVEPLRG